MAIIGIRIAVGFPMTVFGAATTARQRFALNNLVATAVALDNGATTYVVLALGYRVRAVVAASTADQSLLGYIAYAWTREDRVLPSCGSGRRVQPRRWYVT